MTPQPPGKQDKDAGRWSDLDRPPLSGPALRRALVRPGSLWTSLDVVATTGSTALHNCLTMILSSVRLAHVNKAAASVD